jgi:hypothetical protein
VKYAPGDLAIEHCIDSDLYRYPYPAPGPATIPAFLADMVLAPPQWFQPSSGDPVPVDLAAVSVAQGHAAPKRKRKFGEVEPSEPIRSRAAPGRESHAQHRQKCNELDR